MDERYRSCRGEVDEEVEEEHILEEKMMDHEQPLHLGGHEVFGWAVGRFAINSGQVKRSLRSLHSSRSLHTMAAAAVRPSDFTDKLWSLTVGSHW